jgi:hypothetical protein
MTGMDKFSVLFPHVALAILLLLYFTTAIFRVTISGTFTVMIFKCKRARNGLWPKYVWHISQQTWERLIYSAISFFALVIVVFYLIPGIFYMSFHLHPTPNWHEKAKKTDAALIFGFGFGTDEKGNITPEGANQFLYDLAMQQTRIRYLIMQEGVYAAAIKDGDRLRRNKTEPIRMHPHNPKKDVNTYEASRDAILKMDSLHLKRTVVYAHPMQLKRAVADLRRIAAGNPRWKEIEFIVPFIPSTPFPKKTTQKRTNNKVIYRAVELYYSRVRDAWYY